MVDMELDLDALTAALQSVQDQKTKIRLSERNVVELVLKLQQLGLLGEDLLYTINGREYLTLQQLRKEVEEVVQQAGGRISLVDIPPLVNVDLVHVQRVADAFVAESDGAVQMAQGELITTAYYDALAAEVGELLQEVGAISLGDLARQFSLSTELVSQVITARMGSLIQGRLEAGTLYTSAYLDRIKGQLRGALRAAVEPTPVADVAKELDLVSLGSGGGLLGGLVEELAKAGHINGHLRSGGIWTPAVFAAAQQEGVSSFYSTNNYVPYSAVSRLGVSVPPREYLSSKFPEGLALETCLVAPALLQELDSCVEEAAMNGGWCDVSPVAPPALEPADVAQLLERCPAVQAAANSDGGSTLAGSCFVSAAFLQQLREKLLALAREAAEEAVKRRRASGASASSRGGAAGGGGGVHQEAGGKQQQAAAGRGGDDSDEDWDRGGKKSKKGGKGGGKKAGAKGGGGAKGASKQQAAGGKGGAASAAASAADDAAAQRVLSVDGISAQLLKWEQDLEAAGDDGSLPQALAESLRPAAVSEYEASLQRVFTAGAEARRRAADLTSKSLEESMQRYQLYCHGLECMSGDAATHQALARHLLRSVGAEAAHWLLRYMEVTSSDDLGSEGDASTLEASLRLPLDHSSRSLLAKSLPGESGKDAQRVVEQLNGADASAFQAEVERAAERAGLALRLPDKKGERSLVHAHRKALEAGLAAEAEPAAALALLAPLLVAQVHGKAVSVPGRSIGAVLAALRPELPEESYEQLAAFHLQVVNSLKQQQGGGGGNAEQLHQDLLEQLPRVKALAGVGKPPGGAAQEGEKQEQQA